MRKPRGHSVLLSLRNDSESNVLIWKHPEEDFNTNSVLTVQPGENAIFLSEGEIAATFKESGRYELKTNNKFFTGDIRNLLSWGESTFTARLFFIRTNETSEVGWGFGTENPVSVRDPKLHIQTDLTGYGTLRVKIDNAVKLMTRLVSFGIDSFAGDDLMDYFGTQIRQVVKATISKALEVSDREILGITSRLIEYSNELTPAVKTIIEEYGLTMTNFAIGALNIVHNPHRERVEEGFAARQEADILGDKFGQTKAADIGMSAANNPGGAFLGMTNAGLAANFAQGFNNLAAAESQGDKGGKSLSQRLKELKEARDTGLINADEYEDKRKQIINEL